MQEKQLIEIPSNSFVASKHVFRWNGGLYRGYTEQEMTTKEQGLVAKGLSSDMNRLHELGLIRYNHTPLFSKEFNMILKLDEIDFVSYYDEWNKQMLVDAGIVMLDILAVLIRDKYCFCDGHPYNMLFDYTRPVFVDLDSIVPLNLSNAWYTEFYLSFIKPIFPGGDVPALEFWKDVTNRTISDSKRVSTVEKFQEAFLQLVKETRDWFTSVKVEPSSTPWSGYTQPTDELTNEKQRAVFRLLNKLQSSNTTLIDIGSNEGWYSNLATSCGYKVVSFDLDESCVTSLYLKAKKDNRKILTLIEDFMTPHQTHQPYRGAFDRLRCDVGLGLALVHHLVFAQHTNFDTIADRFNAFSKKHVIVEFPPADDMFVKHWMTPQHSWYTIDNLIHSMSKYFPVHEVFDSHPQPRKIVLFSKER